MTSWLGLYSNLAALAAVPGRGSIVSRSRGFVVLEPSVTSPLLECASTAS
eukprot:CAMPEP_0174722332 /NCGR_PEP_ID=MMETSP1094-20130205/38240_1 /TAXON_ID=156173 /ORGANISM="Chrysochromulina brevifilum, Strain UTEX LB 985" /LENGTH=49 /DNA_ID= /DNA_START= /DNA_END= /DNA_ORIENTATION=